jgi:hypothetical protein
MKLNSTLETIFKGMIHKRYTKDEQ